MYRCGIGFGCLRQPFYLAPSAAPATTIDTARIFDFPAVGRKQITAAFNGGRISSDGGVMLLAENEHRLGIADRLAALVVDRRDPAGITYRLHANSDARSS